MFFAGTERRRVTSASIQRWSSGRAVRWIPTEHRDRELNHGWCSLRLRFDERDLTLLKGAELRVGWRWRGTPRPQVLRTALNLAKAGQKLGVAAPVSSVVFEEGEVGLLLEAVRFATLEVQWATLSE